MPDVVGVWEILIQPTPEEGKQINEMNEDSFIDASTGATSSIIMQPLNSIKE